MLCLESTTGAIDKARTNAMGCVGVLVNCSGRIGWICCTSVGYVALGASFLAVVYCSSTTSGSRNTALL